MKGSEIRQILQQHRVNFAWLSEQLSVTPQCLNSRLNAENFKDAYLKEITTVLKKDIFGLNTKETKQPILNIAVLNDLSKELSENNYPVIEYVSIPAFAGCVGIPYYGKDALPKYDSGDVIFVQPTEEEITAGSLYFIITSKFRFIRYAFPTGDADKYSLVPINTFTDHKERKIYRDLTIKKAEIIRAYKVVGAITRFST